MRVGPRKMWLVRLGAAFAAAVVCAFLATAVEIFSFRPPPSTGADAAIVLGAAAWGAEPSPIFRERIRHAVDLYKAGVVRKLIFTGGRRQRADLSEAEVGRRTAIKMGVADNDILVESCSRTTQENLEFGIPLAQKHGLKRLLLVSDPLHLRRAVYLAKALGVDAQASATPTTRIQSFKERVRFTVREVYFLVRDRLHLTGEPPARVVDADVC